MTKEERLKEVFGKEAGFKVPDGYFESFYKNMEESLPAYKEAPKSADPTIWQRVKPYIYMAAMFAGIWVMMKVFHTVYQDSTFNIDNPPEHIAMLMASDPDLDLYSEDDYSSDVDLDSVLGEVDDISEFGKEIGIQLQPDYSNIDVEKVIGN